MNSSKAVATVARRPAQAVVIRPGKIHPAILARLLLLLTDMKLGGPSAN